MLEKIIITPTDKWDTVPIVMTLHYSGRLILRYTISKEGSSEEERSVEMITPNYHIHAFCNLKEMIETVRAEYFTLTWTYGGLSFFNKQSMACNRRELFDKLHSLIIENSWGSYVGCSSIF